MRIKNPLKLFFSHYHSLIVKRLLYFTRDKRGFVCEVFLPCVMVVVGLCLLLISFLKDSPSLAIPDNFYGDNLSVYYGSEPSVIPSDSAAIIAKLGNPTKLNISNNNEQYFNPPSLEHCADSSDLYKCWRLGLKEL